MKRKCLQRLLYWMTIEMMKHFQWLVGYLKRLPTLNATWLLKRTLLYTNLIIRWVQMPITCFLFGQSTPYLLQYTMIALYARLLVQSNHYNLIQSSWKKIFTKSMTHMKLTMCLMIESRRWIWSTPTTWQIQIFKDFCSCCDV